jgi:retron-type reverse transcriptase
MLNYLEQKHILYEKQFGFCAKHSTNQAILNIVDNIQRAIENKEYSCGIFLDFAKAFDTVNHGILLKKLEMYGIRGVANDWFQSYL